MIQRIPIFRTINSSTVIEGYNELAIIPVTGVTVSITNSAGQTIVISGPLILGNKTGGMDSWGSVTIVPSGTCDLIINGDVSIGGSGGGGGGGGDATAANQVIQINQLNQIIITDGGNDSVTTSNTWVASSTSQVCKNLTMINTSGVSILFRQDGGGVEIPILPMSYMTIEGISNVTDIEFIREDMSATTVTIYLRWEN